MAKHRSSQDWSEILSAYDNRNVTQERFCADHRISLASLYYHRRKRKKKPGGDKPKLIELPPPVQAAGRISPPDCRLEYLNPTLGQLKISCSANQLGQIIEELSSACVNDFT